MTIRGKIVPPSSLGAGPEYWENIKAENKATQEEESDMLAQSQGELDILIAIKDAYVEFPKMPKEKEWEAYTKKYNLEEEANSAAWKYFNEREATKESLDDVSSQLKRQEAEMDKAKKESNHAKKTLKKAKGEDEKRKAQESYDKAKANYEKSKDEYHSVAKEKDATKKQLEDQPKDHRKNITKSETVVEGIVGRLKFATAAVKSADKEIVNIIESKANAEKSKTEWEEIMEPHSDYLREVSDSIGKDDGCKLLDAKSAHIETTKFYFITRICSLINDAIAEGHYSVQVSSLYDTECKYLNDKGYVVEKTKGAYLISWKNIITEGDKK